MTENAPMDNRTLLRRTLVTAGAIVGAHFVIVGLAMGIALFAVGHALSGGPGDSASTGTATANGGALVPAANVHGVSPARPPVAPGLRK